MSDDEKVCKLNNAQSFLEDYESWDPWSYTSDNLLAILNEYKKKNKYSQKGRQEIVQWIRDFCLNFVEKLEEIEWTDEEQNPFERSWLKHIVLRKLKNKTTKEEINTWKWPSVLIEKVISVTAELKDSSFFEEIHDSFEVEELYDDE